MAVIPDLPDTRSRLAADLRAALAGDTEQWFSMVDDSFVAAGRKDGAATVTVNSAGWQMVHHLGGQPQVESFGSAADAVTAARKVAA